MDAVLLASRQILSQLKMLRLFVVLFFKWYGACVHLSESDV
jgi:hypothetical protein